MLFETKFKIVAFLLLILLFVSTCDEKVLDPGDQTPPAAITTLTVVDSTARSVVLRWQATGDDGTEGTAAQYELRYDTIYESLLNWDESTVYPIISTPKPNNFYEFFEVKDLDSTKGYFFGLKVSDEAGNWSALSNIVSVHVPDTIFPSAITDLLVTNVDTFSVTLSWTASGDDSTSGLATAYDIRYDTAALSELSWAQANVVTDSVVPGMSGSTESYTVANLIPTTGYYFGIKVIDDAGNASPISNIVSGTTLYKDTSTIIWETTIGGAGDEKVSSIILASDNNFVIAGGITDPGGTSDAYFAKIGSNGVLIWEKRTGGPEPDHAYDLVPLSTGEVVAAGYTGSFGSLGSDVYLIKIEESGVIVWEKHVGGSLNNFAVSIDRALDGGFILGGTTAKYINGFTYSAAYLLKVSALGQIEWQETFSSGQACPPENGYYRMYANGRTALATPDSGYVFSWGGEGPDLCGHASPGPPASSTCFTRTNLNGHYLWSYCEYRPLETSDCGAGPIINVEGGGYLYLHSCLGSSKIAKISTTGALIWLLYDARLSFRKNAGLIQLKSGNFMVALQNGSQIELMVISSSGAIMNSTIINRNNYGTGDLLVQAPDGNIIVAGWYYTANNDWNIRVLKIRNEY